MSPDETNKAILAALLQMNTSMQQFQTENQKETDRRHAENAEKLDRLMKAFPDGDPDAHCAYHQEVIEALRARRKIYQEVLTHLAKTGAWGGLAGLLYGLYLLAKFNLKG